ncbi:MAG: tRNA (adenosine(37)-N6)-threonylcarbamoyltransferase complex ATPase subunit type 1 TsaE [Acidimicrobiales bacterium]
MRTPLELRCTSASATATQALAAAIAPLVDDGDLLVLVGDLGAGKTAFTQGICRALGVDEPVTSPTFTLANRYQGRLVVNHLDVYRIEALAEAEDLALGELLDDGLTLIEWGDVILPALPEDRLDVRITFGAGDDDRVLEFTPVGAPWSDRFDRLVDALGEWTT